MREAPVADQPQTATPAGLPRGLQPAGLQARCYAWLVDLLLRLAILYAVLIVTIGLGILGKLGAAFWLTLALALEWLYPVAFEIWAAGATPGKRLLALRVLGDDNRSVTTWAALLRNLLRAADFLPGAFGAGILCILLRRDCKRLGDLAARTHVVHVPRAARQTTPAADADRGPPLCRQAARWVYPCYALAFTPLLALALALATTAYRSWLPLTLLWWSKPWLDRTLLFALARAARGEPTRPRDLWRVRREVWWEQLLGSWTLRRLSLSRAFTQPVHQLEGLRGAERVRRLQQLRAGHVTASRLLTGAYSTAENALFLALISLALWFAPPGYASTLLLDALFGDFSTPTALLLTLMYGAVVFFLEPFYVAAGLTTYIARRAELEGWDPTQAADYLASSRHL